MDEKTVKLQFEKVAKIFTTQAGREVPVFRELEMAVYGNEFISIVGPSGCGKTTLLSLAAGLLPVTSGRVLMDGREVRKPGRERGVIFQQDAILPWRTVLGNVEYGLELRGVGKAERRSVAREYLKVVNLEKYADFYPKELSGGMKKRVQIAAVFANDPEVLLMDEPFGSLDYPTKCTLQKELLRIWERDRKTTVFITHDLEEAIFLSDRVFALGDGMIRSVFQMPFSRPREDAIRLSPDFQAVKADLWRFLDVSEVGASESKAAIPA